MVQSLREEIEGKLQVLLSPRKNGLDSLFKEVRVFKVSEPRFLHSLRIVELIPLMQQICNDFVHPSSDVCKETRVSLYKFVEQFATNLRTAHRAERGDNVWGQFGPKV